MPPLSTLLSELYRLTSPPPGDAELLWRWVEHRDEDAFAALVARHGRMVHGVCRRILGNSHDAEDAFQAVFLTLARKAAGLRHPEALPGWLHGVAVRLACKARAARRRCQVADASAAEPVDPHPDPLDALSARELLGLIDREIARLPEAYRLPLVLCDLEERTQPEAARLLGWTLGSFRGRLLRGRERLRARLARRGIAPAVLTAACVQGTAEAAALAASVSRLAGRFAACPASAGVSPSVAALVREGIGGMMLAKVKLASVVLLTASTLVAGAGLMVWPTPAPQPAEERAEDKLPNAAPQVRRDQAGDPLPPEALSRLGTTRLRHGEGIRKLAFGPEGKTLVSCGRDGIRFWDTATGKEIQRFPEQSNAQDIALSPDGKLLAIRLNRNNPRDAAIAIREFATGRLLRRFGDGMAPWSVLFSPDGKLLAVYNAHLDIELWDPSSGRHLRTLKGHERVAWTIAFSADSKTLASCSHDKTIRIWDVATGKELRQIKHNNSIHKVALSADGRVLASIDFVEGTHEVTGGAFLEPDNLVRVWDTATGKELRQLAMPAKKLPGGDKASFNSIGFAPDGKTLVTSGSDGALRFWEPETGKELRHIAGFAVDLNEFVFAPDGKSLAIVDDRHAIRLLDLAGGKDRVPSLGHRDRVSSIGILPDGQTVATMSQDGTLRFWEPATGRELRRREVSVDYTRFSGLRPDGQTYLTVGPDKLYRLNDLAGGAEQAVLHGHESPFPAALSPDGKTLASVNADKVVRLLDPATGAVRHALTKVKHFVWDMAFTEDGRVLVVWDADCNVTFWDAAAGKKRGQLTAAEIGVPTPERKGKFLHYTTALSPDGKLLALGLQVIRSQEKILPVVDTASGKVILRFTTAEDGASQMAFSPDGKSLAWGGNLGTTVYLGELASGRVRQSFVGHRGYIGALAFSSDSKMLISASNDTTALVWDLTGRLTMGKKFGAAPSAEELETHWMTLAGDDAAAGYRAIQVLAADPVRSIPYLRKRLHPVAPVDEKRLQQWIADLDSDQFAVREKAVSELKTVGAAALEAMRKALKERPSLETRRRLEQLIEKQEGEDWAPSSDNLR
ncbi:MAG TPA: sigma-70 family RNA polymerase sigma factor, partial [Gemmataceae bacterium]|nr:sigma-70 family RNA polymerase sigma factor [Gemmataceae bacterium]